MMPRRLQACLPAAAFAALAAVMAASGGVPPVEAALAALAAALALVPSGWLAPAGWRRRAAEVAFLAPALALVLVADPTLRRMALPPLLAAAALAAAVAALRGADRRARPALAAALALAVRAAGGLGLAGHPLWRIALVTAAVGAAGWLAGRSLGAASCAVAALLAGVAPLTSAPLPTLAAAALLAAAFALGVRRPAWGDRLAAGWVAGALAGAVVAAALAPWGGISVRQALPGAAWLPAAAVAGAFVATPFLPPALAGAAWLGAAALLGRPLPPPPDGPGVELTAARPEALLPASEGGTYAVEIALANASFLPQGTVVAVVRDVGRDVPVRAGIETAEWAHERADVRRSVPHSLPTDVVWRPAGYGSGSTWAAAGRIEGVLPKGVHPRLVRAERLPPEVVVGVAAAGTSRPTPPRDWPATRWILAAAVAVAALQLAGGTWRSPTASLPWAALAALAAAVRLHVAPLALLAEQHSVDVALLALLAAWLPAARVWLRRGQTLLTAAALLVPLAVATSHTMEAGGDAQYHLIMLRSLAQDHDLDLSNNLDLEHRPENRIYATPLLMHSPALAFALLPGYWIAGLGGALVVIALCGAALVATVARAARDLGLPASRRAVLVSALLLTYPVATYATQIWVEVPGALLAALAALLVASPRRSIGGAALASLAATCLKTRLALATFPVPLLALVGRERRWRELVAPLLAVAAAVAFGLAFGVLVYGHPLGPFRRLGDLVPHSLWQPLTVVGGLAFDSAGGLLFSAPLLLVAAGGARAAWTRGGPGARGLLVAGVATVGALLSSPEWYGGGCPPLRYLVPLVPAFALCGACVLGGCSRWRRVSYLVIPPSVLFWWVVVTRPHVAFNPGDGGSWIADALARRFAADARHLFPSVLRPSPATVLVPLVAAAAAVAVLLVSRRWPAAGRSLASATVAVWLLAASALVLALTVRTDAIVEIEDPQIGRVGGSPEPPLGTFGRYTHPNGWRVGDGEGVDVPLNLPPGARVRLEGWLEGPARSGAALAVRWDDAPARAVAVAGTGSATVALPAPPAGGRHRLGIVLRAPAGGEAVFDRVVVTR